MDKYEYKIRSEEIKSLIAKGEYVEAASIADTIDWYRVKSVMMLCTISDLYKINRRFEDAKELLLMAYDKYPGGRSIVYSLCELSIKMEEFVQAVEYYKEFVQIAPKDSGRYVLQYKLYEAQDVSLEERIEVLEELKTKDYSEKWAYELAYLYHRIGLATKCVEECDELILWFGDGKYVLKAMELKMLHEPLTQKQQEKYYEIKGIKPDIQASYEKNILADVPVTEPYLADAPTKEIPQQELDFQVKLMNVGQYDTINIQKELAQNMKDLLDETASEISFTHSENRMETPDNTETFESDNGFDEADTTQPETDETKVEEVFFGETGEMDNTASQVMEAMKKETETAGEADELTVTPAGDMKEWSIGEPPKQFRRILGMDYDGQISMVMPESEQLEKQITGQISLEDVLLEWEKMKKDSEQKRMEAVRQRVMQQTGTMFSDFEAATRDGLLEKLEKSNAVGLSSEEDINMDLEETNSIDHSEENMISDFDETDIGSMDETVNTEDVEDTEEPEYTEDIEGTEETEDTDDVPYTDDTESTEDDEETEDVENTEDIEYEETEDLEDTDEAEVSEEQNDTYEEVNAEGTPEEDYSEVTEETEGKEEDKGSVVKKGNHISKSEKEDKLGVRNLSFDEKKLYGTYALNKSTKEQIINAIEKISLASHTGNVIITGVDEAEAMNLAMRLLKEVQKSDENFSGKIAKITPRNLSSKGVENAFQKLENGALIIQNAGELDSDTLEQIKEALKKEGRGLVVVLQDTRQAMHKLTRNNETLLECFNIEINIEALDDAALVAYAQKYARELEYSIDELGILALHTRIAERQTSDHSVTISEVKEIMNEAIQHANRKTLGHFFDILLAKRYDEEDMIILREKDFI